MMGGFESSTVEEYIAKLASDEPTPGGGTAAAIALSEGAALTTMVCNLTLGREKWNEGWGIAEIALSVAQPMIGLGQKLANEDAAAFDDVMKAYRMPKETEADMSARKSAIREATHEAALVPLKTANSAIELLSNLPLLAKHGNSNAITDVGVAALLASTASKGAIFNVLINAQSLPDELANPLLEECSEIKEKTSSYSREVMKIVNNYLIN